MNQLETSYDRASNIVNLSYEINSPVIRFLFCPKLVKLVPPQSQSCIKNMRRKNSNLRSKIYISIHEKCNLVKINNTSIVKRTFVIHRSSCVKKKNTSKSKNTGKVKKIKRNKTITSVLVALFYNSCQHVVQKIELLGFNTRLTIWSANKSFLFLVTTCLTK